MLWLVKKVDDDSFQIVDEDIIDGVAAVGKTVTIGLRGGYAAVLKASGRRKALLQTMKDMQDGASTPDSNRRKRKNNMVVASPPSTPAGPSRPSTARPVLVSRRPSSSARGPPAASAVTQTALPSHHSAAAFLPLNASAGLNNVLDGILAYMRQNEENMERMEKKIDDFVLQYAPLIKDGANFAKEASKQLEEFGEWKDKMDKKNKGLRKAVNLLHDKIPSQPGFHYTYLSRAEVDAIDVGSMNAQCLATALQKAIYKGNKKEMLKNVDKRVDQGAVNFIYNCVIYRRQYSTQDQKDLAIRAIRERLNQYATNGRALEKNKMKDFAKVQRALLPARGKKRT